MSIRRPDRAAWIRIYMDTHYDRSITEERAGRAYDTWVAALERGHQLRAQRAGLLRGRAIHADAEHARATASRPQPAGPDWPGGVEGQLHRSRIAELFQEAQQQIASNREQRLQQEAHGQMPSGVARFRLPKSSPIHVDRGYVPAFAVDEDTRRKGNKDDSD